MFKIKKKKKQKKTATTVYADKDAVKVDSSYLAGGIRSASTQFDSF